MQPEDLALEIDRAIDEMTDEEALALMRNPLKLTPREWRFKLRRTCARIMARRSAAAQASR